ncbi:hypothetical protein PR048_014110 [Dryococelus australis]|uniref:Uncharacterized protein n=1 Tax=Dryococelus australis TaxID=614101 RepID=A0ABQ9HE25_9NEOP|nr:hypothetical protein PR048_014110 [Dryococelus australis]
MRGRWGKVEQPDLTDDTSILIGQPGKCTRRRPDLSLKWRKNRCDDIRRENDDIESGNAEEEKDIVKNRDSLFHYKKNEPDAFLSMKNKGSIKPSVTYEFDLCVFNTNFNYSFGYPLPDTCEVCDVLKLKLEKENNDLAQHDPSTEGVCFDFEQNCPVTVLTTGEVFYLRQVWVYNMGFYSCTTGCSKMYMHNEITGKKVSNKTVSLLKHYIEKYIPEHVKTLHLFSDNCAEHFDGTVLGIIY